MRVGEAVLRALSRAPDTADYNWETEEQLSDELLLLRREFPQISAMVKGKSVLDFGCGTGRQAIGLSGEGASRVCGIESNPRTLSSAKQLASQLGIQPHVVDFHEHPTAAMMGAFDFVIAQNSMEHFPDPIAVLGQMKQLIRKDGKLLITFGPPWFAPYGSHMHFFCRVPWVNLLFSEKTVIRVRALYRNDGAQRYEEVESGLNRMTIRKFERIVRESGLRIQYRKYSCVKGYNWLATLPVLRELFVNHITVILTPAG